MTDYTELVRALRCELHGVPCNDENCEWLWHGGGCCDEVRLMLDAADAIEALQATIELMKPYMPDFFPDANKVTLPKMEVQDGQ